MFTHYISYHLHATSEPVALPVSWAFGTYWFQLLLQWPALVDSGQFNVEHPEGALPHPHFKYLSLLTSRPRDSLLTLRLWDLLSYHACTTPKKRGASLLEDVPLTDGSQDTVNKFSAFFPSECLSWDTVIQMTGCPKCWAKICLISAFLRLYSIKRKEHISFCF